MKNILAWLNSLQQTASDYCLLEAYVILSGPYTSVNVKENLTLEHASLTLLHSQLINTSVCNNGSFLPQEQEWRLIITEPWILIGQKMEIHWVLIPFWPVQDSLF